MQECILVTCDAEDYVTISNEARLHASLCTPIHSGAQFLRHNLSHYFSSGVRRCSHGGKSYLHGLKQQQQRVRLLRKNVHSLHGK